MKTKRGRHESAPFLVWLAYPTRDLSILPDCRRATRPHRVGKLIQIGDNVMRFTDKVALITAAASGIGRATSDIIAREGGTVIAVDV